MKEFSIEALARVVEAEPMKSVEGSFTGVSIDSRKTRPGDCFFAVPGDKFDGHDFLADAFAGGAVCAVVSDDAKARKFAGSNLLKVRDTVKALGDLACEYRQRMNFKVVAITGSVGKTTTRQIAFHVLSRRFRAHQAPKNFNNNIGLPLTLLAADPQDEIIIAEVGTNHPGEIADLTRIALPDIAVITNVYPAHLEGLGDLQAIVREKASIAEGLRPNGDLIINADFDDLVSACRATGRSLMTFGKSQAADIRAQDIGYTGAESNFTIDGSRVTVPLPGPGNLENALAAWALCSRFGLTVDDFAQALQTVPPADMRAELLQFGTLTVLSDCYNANPASMKNALEILANIDADKNRRLVFVCGDMAELGQQSRHLHTELGLCVARARVGLMLAVGELARVSADAARESADYDIRTECCENAASACNKLEKFVKDYDIILVKGSRAAGLEIVVDRLKELFS
ncbi:MAG: UDP-N-acetylmuramoyl-tripeptide--D-alanyl-D-alanine ligase [Planctomycetota bacterium]|jgi:UDP-N-acetylmuramoyl-tripeptide--D-alanyl-D-alanine ligase